MPITNKVPFAYRRDIPWNFELDDRGDLKMKEDSDAIKQSIYTILMSNFGDKNFEPTFGSDMESVIMENAYPEGVIKYEITSRIERSIRELEKDVSISSIDIDLSKINNNVIDVTIAFILSDGFTEGVFREELAFADLNR
jgi:phage baseplate assembly protein W